MAHVTEQVVDGRSPDGDADEIDLNHLASIGVVLLAGGGLTWAAHSGALPLLIAVAVVQALLAVAWVGATAMPGRTGGLLIAALAAAGADVAVSVWPHGRLGTLLIVLGLALPVMFVHQLMRGAARIRIVESMSDVAMLVVAMVGLPAFLQLRHEFTSSATAGSLVGGVIAASAGALVIGHVVDLVMPAPRFDVAVPRGLLAVVASAGLGGSIGHLTLDGSSQFPDARGSFAGAALGALAAFFAVAVAFLEFSTPLPDRGAAARRLRPVMAGLLPLSLLGPVAFLLCLAIRA
ncbi:MAG: hypothetical protein QOH14_1703 [Pseudonocardiales bacterium]|nr:hypothetical protein [Pseudonocardiales bacterium]